MAWLYVMMAGLTEVFWATCLKLSDGFTNLKFTLLTLAGMVVPFYFLSQSTKALLLGTAYAIWTGIGALGAVFVGIIWFEEAVSLSKLFFVFLLLVGLIGLKMSSGH
ncbi:DMT family transporter [Streptococcus sp. zg-JUN1979]|uniref:DMT family transporter n=1 Tax=Streptococcus sp. zg-JUN1979 TaxID=3391450 RepID=UPI0039A51AFE